jgi:predicted PolB exonuclease-like 3'-5' exonuclease
MRQPCALPGLAGLTGGLGSDVADEAVREAIGRRYSRDGQAPLDVFLKPPLHRILCIGALFAERENDRAYIVRRLGARHIGDKSEANLVSDFVAALPRDDAGKGPVLVSFNGGGFDLPVLRYRALAHGAPVPALFGNANRDYWYRFGWDHIDLCDMLSGFGASARPSLDETQAATSEASLDAAIERHLEHWPLLAEMRQDGSPG